MRSIPGLPASLAIPNETYDGGAHEPPVELPGLVEGKDYRVDGYEHNVDAGAATIHITGLGALAGQSAAYTFTIDPAALPQPEALQDYIYTGRPIEPEVVIPGLVPGRDFSVRFEDNILPARPSPSLPVSATTLAPTCSPLPSPATVPVAQPGKRGGEGRVEPVFHRHG